MSPRVEAIIPDWQVPNHVHALVTLRTAGFSQGNYQGFNLALHVGDKPQAVSKNRQLLLQAFQLPEKPYWLEQTHSTKVIELPVMQADDIGNADAAWTNKPATVCAVLTADCLPVFFYHAEENKVAVAHAGWRGLANGVIEQTISKMTKTPELLKVWLGPAIGADEFEVGEEVKDIFCLIDPDADQCFRQAKKIAAKQHYLADIYQLAKRRLYNVGVTTISGGDYCTVSDEQRFFSYRRDGQTGRMASLIWLSEI